MGPRTSTSADYRLVCPLGLPRLRWSAQCGVALGLAGLVRQNVKLLGQDIELVLLLLFERELAVAAALPLQIKWL